MIQLPDQALWKLAAQTIRRPEPLELTVMCDIRRMMLHMNPRHCPHCGKRMLVHEETVKFADTSSFGTAFPSSRFYLKFECLVCGMNTSLELERQLGRGELAKAISRG